MIWLLYFQHKSYICLWSTLLPAAIIFWLAPRQTNQLIEFCNSIIVAVLCSCQLGKEKESSTTRAYFINRRSVVVIIHWANILGKQRSNQNANDLLEMTKLLSFQAWMVFLNHPRLHSSSALHTCTQNPWNDGANAL